MTRTFRINIIYSLAALLLGLMSVLCPLRALAGAGSDVPPDLGRKSNPDNATVVRHATRDHVPAREKTYKGLFCLDGVRHPGKNLDELKKDLELTARKAILLEILNAHFAEEALVKPAPLLRDEAIAPYLKTLEMGDVRYFNGRDFGELCLECTGRLNAQDRKLLQENHGGGPGILPAGQRNPGSGPAQQRHPGFHAQDPGQVQPEALCRTARDCRHADGRTLADQSDREPGRPDLLHGCGGPSGPPTSPPIMWCRKRPCSNPRSR